MNWVTLIGAVLQIALILLKEWEAKKNGPAELVEELQRKRLELLEAISSGNSGWISRNSAARADRLRIILGLRQGGQSSERVPGIHAEGSDLPIGGNSGAS